MKKIYHYLLCLLPALMLTGCNNDGDLVYLNGFESSDLIATSSDVSLSVSNSKTVVLSLAWKNPTLLSSDADNPAPDGLIQTYLQVSASNDFVTFNENNVTTLSKAYTGTELNTLAKALGVIDGTPTPLYFRIKSTQGDNMTPAYSNVCTVNVTTYSVIMDRLAVLDKDKSATLAYLYSPEENGIYTGFMQATSWLNCWFSENDGTVWGNYAADGHAFELSDASDAWNCWFSEGSGHWFVEVNTVEQAWSATNITSMKLNDDNMTYDSQNSRWTYAITTTGANTSFTITADGLEYNTTTRDSKEAAVAKTLHFALDNGSMTLADAGQSAVISAPGTYTITVSIGEEGQYQYSVTEGTTTPDEPETKFPTELYMCTTDGSATLTVLTANGEEGVYTGSYTPSAWENFKLIDKENNIWYGSDPSDQFTLSSDGGAYNIWFNDDVDGGTAVTITADLKNMKWSYSY